MSIGAILKPHVKDLGGGFIVRRLLPSHRTQSVGPFLFLDHFGPATHSPQADTDVRPHPHIGLAAVTYLFEGAIEHRDSLGHVQRIEPGAINWMTAGRGIVHSERTPADLKGHARAVHGLQLWAALPRAYEEAAPSFTHTPAAALPRWDEDGVAGRVLIGRIGGLTSPVATFADTLYLDITLAPGARFVLDDLAAERAVHGLDAALMLDDEQLEPGVLALLAPQDAVRISAPSGGRFVVLGGDPVDGRRFMWWNFVSSRRERIEQAKEDWRAQRFAPVPGEHDFIALPD